MSAALGRRRAAAGVPRRPESSMVKTSRTFSSRLGTNNRQLVIGQLFQPDTALLGRAHLGVNGLVRGPKRNGLAPKRFRYSRSRLKPSSHRLAWGSHVQPGRSWSRRSRSASRVPLEWKMRCLLTHQPSSKPSML